MSIPVADAGQLIRRARAGSNSALGTLLNGYRAYLLHFANQRVEPGLRPKLAASDIVQGSMLVATREFQNFRGDSEAEFRAWLLQIVNSQLIDGLRRFLDAEKRRSDRDPSAGDTELKRIADAADSPSRLASLEEEAAALLTSIQSLPDEVRMVVQARYLEGLTFAEVAERLKIPVTTCRRRWLEGIESIGQRMGFDL
jgi:RNA polymerase sigma-70 factor (ECF subfamily)